MVRLRWGAAVLAAAALLAVAGPALGQGAPQSPNLVVAMSHSGSFQAGQQGTYMVVVANLGSATTVGPVELTDVMPTGFLWVASAGNGWTCQPSPGAGVCEHSGPLAVGDSTALSITIGAQDAAVPMATNTVQVATAGDSDLSNNVTRDPTEVRPAPVADPSTTTPSSAAVTTPATDEPSTTLVAADGTATSAADPTTTDPPPTTAAATSSTTAAASAPASTAASGATNERQIPFSGPPDVPLWVTVGICLFVGGLLMTGGVTAGERRAARARRDDALRRALHSLD